MNLYEDEPPRPKRQKGRPKGSKNFKTYERERVLEEVKKRVESGVDVDPFLEYPGEDTPKSQEMRIQRKMVYEMAKRGLRIPEMARELGLSPAALHKRFKQDARFRMAVEQGRVAYFLPRIESSLERRALGYQAEEKETKVYKDKDGNVTSIVEQQTQKHVPADVNAIKFALSAHDKDRYGEAAALSGASAVVLLPSKASMDDWASSTREHLEAQAEPKRIAPRYTDDPPPESEWPICGKCGKREEPHADWALYRIFVHECED